MSVSGVPTVAGRADKVEELLELRDRVMVSNIEWAEATRRFDPEGKGVHYQTIRRIENGKHLPRPATLRVLEDALRGMMAERERGIREFDGD